MKTLQNSIAANLFTTPLKHIRIILCFILGVGCLGMYSCKKSTASKTSSGSACKMTTAQVIGPGDTLNLAFSYDGQGRMQTLTNISSKSSMQIVYQYSAGLVLAKITTAASGTTTVSTDSIIVNSSNQVTAFYVKDNTGKVQQSGEFTLNSDGGDVALGSNGGPSTVITNTNGDITGISTTGEMLTYDTSHPIQMADYLYLTSLTQYGYMIFANKHMLTSDKNGSTTTVITYTYDSKGNVISFIVGGALSETATFNYQCN